MMHMRTDILGVPISVVDMPSAIHQIGQWADAGETRYVCAADVNSVMQAQRNPAHLSALRSADMVLPDGTPLVWVSRLRGQRAAQRVPGPDIMLQLCAAGVGRGWRHYFYGGAEGVADGLAQALQRRFPGLLVAGTHAPPFRPLSPAEQARDLEQINAARPHIVWVGLGCPKQEMWMRENAAKLKSAVVIGVGAAFDFHAGRIPRAPVWMRRNGLEWLHRLGCEPARLWRRYLVLGPAFLARAAVETFRLRLTGGRVTGP
jgi:N-acetylglucosaminyldiphosphoundecaprenol N-acetyl-beta-D-mannosaminyltransferase